MDGFGINVFVEILHIIPPFINEIFNNDTTPRSDHNSSFWIISFFEKGFKLVLIQPASISDFIGVGINLDILLNEENIVD